jgi:hypothetical protein
MGNESLAEGIDDILMHKKNTPWSQKLRDIFFLVSLIAILMMVIIFYSINDLVNGKEKGDWE